jgi:hypothetical protein
MPWCSRWHIPTDKGWRQRMTAPPPDETGRLFAKLLRYAMAIIGPVGTAGSQFMLALLMLRRLDPAEFGTFSFLLILSQFSMGLWSALFCAPLPVVLHEGTEGQNRRSVSALFAANLLLALGTAALFCLVAKAFGAGLEVVLAYGAFAALGLLRWFARAQAYALGQPARTALSDGLYSLTLLGVTAGLFFYGRGSVGEAFLALLLATLASFLPFGRRYFAQQFARLEWGSLPAYADVWNRHARWALVGVITTEATVNAHAYVVSLLAGPSAFAPLAASALLTRPVGVVMSALSEFERATMARQIKGDLAQVYRSVRLFRGILILVWTATAALGAALVIWVPHWIFPKDYSLPFLTMGLALWMAVVLVRAMRMPESTLLQAGGVFRPLAEASMISCGISMGAVTVFLLLYGPLWSIAGVLLGEVIFASWIWRQAARWRQSREEITKGPAA